MNKNEMPSGLKFTDDDSAQKYIESHTQDSFTQEQLERRAESRELLSQPLKETFYKEKGHLEFCYKGVKFVFGYRKVYPALERAMVWDEWGLQKRNESDNVLNEEDTLHVFPQRYYEDKRWDYVIELLDLAISFENPQPKDPVYRLRHEDLKGARIYFNPEIDPKESRIDPNHDYENSIIYIPGNINSIMQILIVLHEAGHEIIERKNPERAAVVHETRFKASVDEEVPITGRAENLNEERDADAYAIQAFRPFMRKMGIDSKIILDFFNLRTEDITGLKSLEGKK